MSKQLENLLRQTGLLNDARLNRSLEQARKQGIGLLDVVLKEEQLTEEQIADAFASRLNVPRMRVAATLSDPDALRKVPDKIARKHYCLPLSAEGRVLTLAMADPGDYQAIQDVEFSSGLSVRPVVATRSEILSGIDERYAAEDRIGTFLAHVPEVTDLHIVADDSAQDLVVEVADSRSAAEVAPVVKMCNLVIHDAIKAGASDMHIEPTMHDVQVRMRVDGVLRDYTHVPKWLHSPVVSRLKILAKLDISERRLPQDGRINVQYQGRSIDIRVSTLPTHFGEKAVLRFLGGGTLPKIDRMGLQDSQAAILEGAIAQPQGMILVTGPTGSGKTTTLYALLAKRRSPEVNIVTVEDPIEYQLPGINQVQINPKAGLSFAGVLRSILRQDPDVILVGETRDQETAEVGFQAAMTGHLVLTTLHTNSAVAAIARLYDLDVDPSILATSLTLVIAQRLVRRICDQCRESYLPDATTAVKVGLTATDGPVFRGRGCSACGGTGFSGRVGIYEFFRPNNTIRKLISNRSSENDLRAAARQSGMKTLREDALDKVKAGITSPDEVLRVVQVDESETPCMHCGALIESDFSTCPYCLSSLKKTCAGCGQELKLEWKACPYCNKSVADAPGGEPAVKAAGTAPAKVAPPAEPPPVPPPPAPPVPPAPPPSAPPTPPEPHAQIAPAASIHGLEGFVPTRYGEHQPPAPPAHRPVSPPPPPPPPARVAEPPAPVPRAFEPAPAPHAFETPGNILDGGESDIQRMIADAAAAFPLKPAPVELPPPGIEDHADGGLPAFDPGRRLLIMVVDDDDDIRQVVAFTLKKLPVPVDIVQAIDGQEAVEMAAVHPPDLVVLDVMMPRLDGFETCARLRQSVRTAFVPILMLTASADELSRSKGYLMGTDDYMSKPFQPIDLKLRVSRLLRRTYGV